MPIDHVLIKLARKSTNSESFLANLPHLPEGDRGLVEDLVNNNTDVVRRNLDARSKFKFKETTFRLAAIFGNEGIVDHLADSVDQAARNLAFRDAAKKGHLKVIKTLCDKVEIHRDEEINGETKPNAGRLALLYAAGRGYLDIVKYLLDKGVLVDSVNDGGRTSLELATRENYVEMAKILLDKGVHVNGAINEALELGRFEITKMLLNQKPEAFQGENSILSFIPSADIKYGEKKLPAGQCEETHLLVLNEIIKNCPSSHKGAYLLQFTSIGQEKIVDFLLDNGADPSFLDKQINFPLRNAISCLNQNIFKTLLDHGANIDNCGKEGLGILHYISSANDANYRLIANCLRLPESDDYLDQNKLREKYALADSSSHVSFSRKNLEKLRGKISSSKIALREIISLALKHGADFEKESENSKNKILEIFPSLRQHSKEESSK